MTVLACAGFSCAVASCGGCAAITMIIVAAIKHGVCALSDEGDTCSQHAGLKRSAGIVAIVAAPFLVVAVLLAIGYVAKHAGRAEKARGESDLALAEQGKSTTTVTSDTISVNPADTTKASEGTTEAAA